MPTATIPLTDPQGPLFLTDGGLETTLVFHERMELPAFAAYPLLLDEEGRARLRQYYERYIGLARAHAAGFVLETPTWRASVDWGTRLGHDASQLVAVNRTAVRFLQELRDRHAGPELPMVVSGCLGPRGDGYSPEAQLAAADARAYHTPQIATLCEAGADVVAAFTMTHTGEAIGVARAAVDVGIPVVISFTTEIDGRLPSGETLADAIARTDDATRGAPLYYMVNCAHPTHLAPALADEGAWRARIGGVRANASTRSHAELDASTELDAGDPHRLGEEYRALRAALPALRVVGGCCGTDHRHVAAIARALLGASPLLAA
jgi:homocysteine S-methyltransferase